MNLYENKKVRQNEESASSGLTNKKLKSKNKKGLDWSHTW